MNSGEGRMEVRTNQLHRIPITTDTARQETAGDRDDMRRRVDEPETPLSPVVQHENPVLNPVSSDMETRNDEIAADVPLPEEPAEVSGDQPQGWITEEAFVTVSPGAGQVRQRKEIKLSQLTPAERREFPKSMDTEWQTLLKNQAATVFSLEETARARERRPDRAMDTRWARTWKPDDSMSSGRRATARLIIKGFTDPDLLEIESHSPTLTREGFMTVLQSVCSHGHKLQFGDVQQAFNTGEPIKREQPLFVRMPPDGVPGESRDVWVQLLETVIGLADGTGEWRNCFLATARGLGFETSVLEPCVLVLRSTQQGYHGIIGVAVDDTAGGGDEVWEQAITKLKKRFTFGHWRSGKRRNSAVEKSHKQLMDPCASGSQPTSRAWTLCLSENLEKSNREMRPRLTQMP